MLVTLRRDVLWFAGAAVLAVALAEVLLHPAGDERWHLVLILAVPSAVAAATVPLLRRWVTSRASVAGAALVVGLCSLAVGALTTTAATNAMFLSDHDFRLFLVVLVLASGLALAVGVQLSRPLAADVARLGQVARRVADGDLTARSGVRRTGELGDTARAIDDMVERLAQADADRARLERARTNLLSSVGHDLRTPLAALRAALESIQDGVAPDPNRYLATMAGQLDTIDGLLDELFHFARVESGQAGSERILLSMSELAHEAVEAVTPVADRADVSIALRADGPAKVLGSPSELGRVLRNLLDNAIRHSPGGASVGCVVSMTAAEKCVQVTVTDAGPGFPSDFRHMAFEPFSRADSARSRPGSSGLGLAIARALVEAHHGSIGIDDVAHGSVTLVLPGAPS